LVFCEKYTYVVFLFKNHFRSVCKVSLINSIIQNKNITFPILIYPVLYENCTFDLMVIRNINLILILILFINESNKVLKHPVLWLVLFSYLFQFYSYEFFIFFPNIHKFIILPDDTRKIIESDSILFIWKFVPDSILLRIIYPKLNIFALDFVLDFQSFLRSRLTYDFVFRNYKYLFFLLWFFKRSTCKFIRSDRLVILVQVFKRNIKIRVIFKQFRRQNLLLKDLKRKRFWNQKWLCEKWMLLYFR